MKHHNCRYLMGKLKHKIIEARHFKIILITILITLSCKTIIKMGQVSFFRIQIISRKHFSNKYNYKM